VLDWPYAWLAAYAVMTLAGPAVATLRKLAPITGVKRRDLASVVRMPRSPIRARAWTRRRHLVPIDDRTVTF